MKKSEAQNTQSPSRLIDARIKELGDWRGEMLSRLRSLIKEADPDVVEEWKWRGVPVWSHDGLICTGETYKEIVKMTFAKGAALKDPLGLFVYLRILMDVDGPPCVPLETGVEEAQRILQRRRGIQQDQGQSLTGSRS